MIVCMSFQKPLILFHLVHELGVTNALVFTKSAESTTRLVKLFECFETARGSFPGGPVAHAYSSDLSAAERKIILDKFKSQEITMSVLTSLNLMPLTHCRVTNLLFAIDWYART
jgi:ATP-dependent RNA helicase DDX51/DBP6